MEKDDFDEWLKHPITKDFLEYLSDFRKRIIDNHGSIIGGGGTVDESTQIRDGEKCVFISELLEIEFEDIQNFYEMEKVDEASMGSSSDST